MNLRFDLLPELPFNHLEPATSVRRDEHLSGQDAATFAGEAERVAASSPNLKWTNPSGHDQDRPIVLNALAFAEPTSTFDYSEPVGSGRIRGLVLHKLMEEFLTGELAPGGNVVERARVLLEQLLATENALGELPFPEELAATAIRTTELEQVSKIWPTLVPEVPIWSQPEVGVLLAGRADAVSIVGGRIAHVFDWKSDRDPLGNRSLHVGQMQQYLRALGAEKGTIVYMTSGETVPVVV